MSLASRAGDLFYTFRFLKLFTTKWTETDAYKLGIVDENGKRIRSKDINTSEEKDAYSTFNRLVFNLKRLFNKVPGGKSVIGSYAAGLLLLRDQYNMSDASIEKIVKGMELDPLNLISEKNEWFMMEDGSIAPGMYKLRENKLTSDTLDDIIYEKDKIIVHEDCFAIDSVYGIPVYKATHVNTKRPVYITLGEIYK
ncbi:hypothetical protein OAA26_00485 [bacterium]|nr:hypothetical protein [bacterium]